MKSIKSAIGFSIFFYAFYYLCMAGLFMVFAFSIKDRSVSFIFRFFSALADAAVFTLPVIFLKGKWKYFMFAFPILISILLFANILYFRNFTDLISPSQYFHSQISDNSVIEGAKASLYPIDILYVILPLLPLILGRFLHKEFQSIKATIQIKLALIVILVGTWGITWLGSYRRIAIYSDLTESKKIIGNMYPKNTTNWRFYYNQHNFTGYLFKVALNQRNVRIKLSPEDKKMITDYLVSKHDKSTSLNSYESPRNLIFIVVESLPWKAVEIDALDEVAPRLAELKNDTSVLKVKLLTLEEIGRSSDAQFIYNTGLLPLRNEPLVSNYAYGDYPSIAKALKIPSIEIIGEEKGLWSHALTNRSYGFSQLIDSVAPKGLNQDSIIFRKTEEILDTLKTPFFLFITTLSMHDPYVGQRVTDEVESNLTNISDKRDIEYLRRLRHFDRSLAQFLNFLKKHRKYDDSLIVIVGDHEINDIQVSSLLHDDSVAMFILNSPLKNLTTRQFSQIDVYPTLLEIFNTQGELFGEEYLGIGQSIFNRDKEVEPAPTEKDYEISEMIIKAKE